MNTINISFNTGRHYGPEGQQIFVEFVPAKIQPADLAEIEMTVGALSYFDETRGLWDTYPDACVDSDMTRLQSSFMTLYDSDIQGSGMFFHSDALEVKARCERHAELALTVVRCKRPDGKMWVVESGTDCDGGQFEHVHEIDATTAAYERFYDDLNQHADGFFVVTPITEEVHQENFGKPVEADAPAPNMTSAPLYEREITEAIDGSVDHVQHVSRVGRTVAIRESSQEAYFNLTFSDPDFDLGTDSTLYDLTRLKAASAVRTFLQGTRHNRSAVFTHHWINQKSRRCQIIKSTATRIRMEYELPTAGLVGCWRKHLVIGSRRYIGPGM